MEKPTKHLRVAVFSRIVICNGALTEKSCQQRAFLVYPNGHTGFCKNTDQIRGKPFRERFKIMVHVQPPRPDFRERCISRSHGQRIPAQCPSLVDGPLRCEERHDLSSSTVSTARNPATYNFTQAGNVGCYSVYLLRAAHGESE